MNHGTTDWYLARCEDCQPRLVQPFLVEAKRDEWTSEHETTGHRVTKGTKTSLWSRV